VRQNTLEYLCPVFFQASLIFASNAKSLPIKMSCTNTVAYFVATSVTKSKFNDTDRPVCKIEIKSTLALIVCKGETQ
jgi:hypothetical protein